MKKLTNSILLISFAILMLTCIIIAYSNSHTSEEKIIHSSLSPSSFNHTLAKIDNRNISNY